METDIYVVGEEASCIFLKIIRTKKETLKWLCVQVGVLEAMPEGKKGGRRVTKQGQQDCDRIAKEIWESKQN